MKIQCKIVGNIVIVTSLVIIVAILAGCKTADSTTTVSTTPSDKTLTFTTIFGGSAFVGGPYQDESSQLRVIMDIASVSSLSSMLYSYDMDALLKVDYTHYFVVIAFNGYRGGIYNSFTITSILQSGNRILISAIFNDRIVETTPITIVPVNSSPYQAVQIDRNILPKTGNLTFKLLDENGSVRASSILTFENK
jgi:hypothetical protein